MELHLYLAFVAATAVMIALPGPSVLLTIAHSISYGWQQALATVAGETVGIALQLAVAAVGLASLVHSAAEVFDLLRWAGAVYLVYLGVRQWLNADRPLDLQGSEAPQKNLFFQGLIITLPNPKSLIFIAAFLPQFINRGRSMGIQLGLIVPSFLFITFTMTSLWAIVISRIKGLLSGQRNLTVVLRLAGGLMIIAGAGLALMHHKV